MFPVENQKGIQEKQLLFCTVPSRASLGGETRCDYRSLTILSLPTLCCGCDPGASVGECVQGPVCTAGCELLATAMKLSESTWGPNRIEMT